MNNMINDLLDAIWECGTIMEKPDLIEMAYQYGRYNFVEDAEGNVIEVEKVPDFQAVADIYTDGFDCKNY